MRLVACGYSQIPGVDFTDSFAPVINDVSWRILLIVKMLMRHDAKIVDVETAFPFGDLDEEVHMTCKEVHDSDEVLLLVHSLYGLVQSTRQHHIEFEEKSNEIGFVGGHPDPCLWMRKNEKGTVCIAVWVDDSLLIGDSDAIEDAVKDLEAEGFKLKIEGTLEDCLSCEITFNEDETVGWIHQPHLITKLEKHFGDLVKDMQIHKTPVTPGETVLKKDLSVIGELEHGNHRSGIGMSLHLVKHTRPDIANAVRELSKALSSPSPAAKACSG